MISEWMVGSSHACSVPSTISHREHTGTLTCMVSEALDSVWAARASLTTDADQRLASCMQADTHSDW